MNLIQHGLLSIAAGVILRDTGLVKMEGWSVLVVAYPHLFLWALDVVGFANAWWGTNRFLKLVWPPVPCTQYDIVVEVWKCCAFIGVGADEQLAKESGATGGKNWQEVVVACLAPVAGMLIPAWGVLAYNLICA